MSVDRTRDFLQIARSLDHPPAVGPRPLSEDTKRFNILVSSVVNNLTTAQQTLDELTETAKSTRYSGNSSQLQKELTLLKNIFSDVEADIKKAAAISNTPEPVLRQHRVAAVHGMRLRLAGLTRSLERSLESHRQAEIQMSERRSQLVGQGNPTTQLREVSVRDDQLGDFLSSPGTTSSEGTAPQQEQVALAALTVMPPDEALVARAAAVQSINQQLAELCSMYQEMGAAVQQQDEIISRIDDDLVQSERNIEQGQHHLRRAAERTRGNKSLLLKVFGAVAAFGLVCVIL